MIGTSHALFATSVYVGVQAGLFGAPLDLDLLLGTAAAVVGSLAPDVDHAGSTVGRAAGPLGWLTQKTLGHRGPLHSPLVAVAVLVAFSYLSGPMLGGSLFLGWFSHLVADALSARGIPWLWPFSSKHRLRSPIPIRVGGGWEQAFVFLNLGVSAILLLPRLGVR